MKRALILGALLLVAAGVTLAIFCGDSGEARATYGRADLPALQQRMAAAAQEQHFEEAAKIRDLIAGVDARGSAAEYEGRGHMNRVLLAIDRGRLHLTITGWKILGYAGILMFGCRWLVQAWYRRRTGRSDMPTMFWIISLGSATMVTMYFIWGKNDSVGIIGNALPAGVALYNLILDLKLQRTNQAST